MKKSFFLMSLVFGLFVSMLSLTACSSDDDDNNSSSNPLIGTWYCEFMDGELIISEITFNKDYTCTSKEYNSDRTTIKFADTGIYKVDGNKVSIWWDSEKEYWAEDGPYTFTFTITGNKMSATDAGGYVESYTKK